MSFENTISVLEIGRVQDDFKSQALAGLLRDPKKISPKYLYDRRGSELFEQICELDEYYPTRTETGILQKNAREIAADLGKGVVLIEPGSGSCQKAKYLLKELEGPRAYIPMDIERSALSQGVKRLSKEMPHLTVKPVRGDYARGLGRLKKLLPDEGRRAVFFPGSTIGNFEINEAESFIADCADLVGPEGAMLVGIDLIKSAQTLEAAYDDALGVTAAFNLNLLERMNRELDADFDLSLFTHRARYDRLKNRVEMHLVSQVEQRVKVGNCKITFYPGETIHTESSHKYSLDGIRALAARGGFRLHRTWLDPEGLFCLALLRSIESMPTRQAA